MVSRRLTTNNGGLKITTIIIDSREPAHVKSLLPKEFPKINFSIEALPEGDFMSEHVIIERKTIGDLWSSAMGTEDKVGRLAAQRSRLVTHQCDKIVIFLITGSVDEWLLKMKKLNVKVSGEIIDGIIASLIVRDNIRVICDSHEKAALKRMVRIIQKIEEDKLLDVPSYKNPDTHMAKLLNISKTDWLNIKDAYGPGLCHLCSRTEKDFMKIPGIGKTKAHKIVEILKVGW